MIVGRCRVDLALPDNGCLKGKRRVVKSLIARTRNRYNVSIAEVDRQDRSDWIALGMAVVTTDRRHADSVLGEVIRWLATDPEAVLCESSSEIG